MPFTLCHPAIVLPLYRSRRSLSLAGLVIGSMAPDFVYFFSLGVSGSFTHTLLGVPLYCVPAGMLLYFVYHLLIREPALAWVPSAISSRIGGPAYWPLRATQPIAIVMGSIATGAVSHIAWDSFTHANTMLTNSYEILRTLFPLGGYKIPLFKILQHLSSLVGFIVIAGFLAHWYKHTKPCRAPTASLSTRQRLLSSVAVALAAMAGGVVGVVVRHQKSTEHGLFNFVVTGMAASALAIMALCFVWQVSVRHNANSA